MAELSRPIDKEFNVEVEGGRFSTEFLNDLVDIICHGQTRLIIQCGKRLIQKQQGWSQNQGADQRRTLPHATG